MHKFFPEDLKKFDDVEFKDLRGGDKPLIKELIKSVFEHINNDRALALFSLFKSMAVVHFSEETVGMLANARFISMCSKNGKLIDDPVCEVIAKYDLDMNSVKIRKLILDKELYLEDKVKLLKIKLDWLINGDYKGKKRFFVACLIGIILSAALSCTGGLAVVLNALVRLLKEGRLDYLFILTTKNFRIGT